MRQAPSFVGGELTKVFDDQGEMNKGWEHHVAFLESGEDTAKQSLDLVSLSGDTAREGQYFNQNNRIRR